MKKLAALQLVTMCMVAAFLARGAVQAQEYRIHLLDKFYQTGGITPYHISEKGISAGWSIPLSGDWFQPVLVGGDGVTYLPVLEEHQAGMAWDVNEQDVAVGQSDLLENMGSWIKDTPYAVMWSGGEVMDLSSLASSVPDDFHMRLAIRINQKGQILGQGRYSSPMLARAFFYDEGAVIDIGALNWTGTTEPYDMNEQGHIVGSSQSKGLGFDHAFLWKEGVMTDLHDPVLIPGPTSTAWAINEAGMIAGSACFTAGVHNETAVIWDHGEVISLDAFGGDVSSARDLNDHGTVVGCTILGPGVVHGFIYEDGEMTDLNDLIPPASGWVVTVPYSINNSGTIVGEGIYGGGFRSFVMNPDSEGGFKIYGTGAAGTGGYTPGFYGQGFPEPNGEISTVLITGMGGAPGLLLFGSGHGTVAFKPGVDIQILPLLPFQVPLALQGSGAGAGYLRIKSQIPPGVSPMMITMQMLFADPGGPSGFTVSNPLELNL
jgi:probable HAF family extracellular repeat protein